MQFAAFVRSIDRTFGGGGNTRGSYKTLDVDGTSAGVVFVASQGDVFGRGQRFGPEFREGLLPPLKCAFVWPPRDFVRAAPTPPGGGSTLFHLRPPQECAHKAPSQVRQPFFLYALSAPQNAMRFSMLHGNVVAITGWVVGGQWQFYNDEGDMDGAIAPQLSSGAKRYCQTGSVAKYDFRALGKSKKCTLNLLYPNCTLIFILMHLYLKKKKMIEPWISAPLIRVNVPEHLPRIEYFVKNFRTRYFYFFFAGWVDM